tara:strand:- start:2554 stop:2823 length:270 start_codon:yes stop_codon:yes gene_type:complete
MYSNKELKILKKSHKTRSKVKEYTLLAAIVSLISLAVFRLSSWQSLKANSEPLRFLILLISFHFLLYRYARSKRTFMELIKKLNNKNVS